MATTAANTERVIDLFRRAAEANVQTPGRRGNVVVLSPENADELLIAADLHGQRLNFQKLLARADLANHPRRHLIMQEVCHGGPKYPGGGSACMSHLLLEDVAELKANFPDRLHFLLSNHEMAELMDFPIAKGGCMLNLQFRNGVEAMYGAAAPRVREAYNEFLRTCPLAVRLTSGVFICHGSPERVAEDGFDTSVLERPLTTADLRPRGAAFRLVWGRDFRRSNADAFAKLVGADVLIHGHEPCAEGFQTLNDRQVILDCCGDQACFLLLPVGERLTFQQIAARIQRL